MKEIMKRIIILFCVVLVLGVCTACGKNPEYYEYYEERMNDYVSIATYVKGNYKAETDDEPITIFLSDISTEDKELNDSRKIVEEKFTYVWVWQESIIFWNDETKTLGLLYSENAKDEISKISEWYDGLDAKRIDEEWYLIGQIYRR